MYIKSSCLLRLLLFLFFSNSLASPLGNLYSSLFSRKVHPVAGGEVFPQLESRQTPSNTTGFYSYNSNYTSKGHAMSGGGGGGSGGSYAVAGAGSGATQPGAAGASGITISKQPMIYQNGTYATNMTYNEFVERATMHNTARKREPRPDSAGGKKKPLLLKA